MRHAEAPWRVELSTTAADQVRAIAPVHEARLHTFLDGLAEGLPDGAERQDATGTWRCALDGTGISVHLLVRPGPRVLLVFRIEEAAALKVVPRPALASGLASAWFDLRAAARALVRVPTFSLGVVLTLALGIGGAATILGLVHGVFRGPLPFEDGDRVVRIRSRAVGAAGPFFFNVTPRDFALIRDGNRSFSGVVAQSGRSISLVGDGPARRAQAIAVSEGWARMLGLDPVVGRAFTPEEERLGEDAGVALLSHALWLERFGGDPSAIGSDLRYDGGTLRIVGVLPARFAYPYDADLWTPWRADPADFRASGLNVVARLAPGVDLESAGADVDALYAELRASSPGTARLDGFGVQTARDDFIRTQAASLQSLAVAVSFILLLVCANVANLFVARSAARRREIAVRAALGAGRFRQLRWVVLESILLFLAGGALGLLLVGPLGSAMSILVPDVLRTQLDVGLVRIGPGMIAWTVGIAVATGAATGVVAAGIGRFREPHAVLRSGSRGASEGGGRLRDGLVVAELALALALLVGASVMGRHFERLHRADLGFDTDRITTAQLSLEQERYGSADARLQLYRSLRSALSERGIVDVGLTSVNPLCCGDWGASIRVEGVERPPDAPPITVHHRYVSREYFDVMGIPILDGRGFSGQDGPDAPPAVVIDEDLAARFWPGQRAIGRRVSMDREGAEWRTVVGVVARAHAEGDPRETWYLPFEQDPLGGSNETVHLMIGSRAVDEGALREAVGRVDPTLAVFGFTTLESQRGERLAQDRIGAAISVGFAGAGLILAAVGLYGLLAYQVERSRRELGTRVALGATRGAIGGWILGRTGRLLLVGLTLGLALALGVSATIARLVAGAEPADWGVLGFQCAVLSLTMAAATVIPTLRALSLDPAEVLKGD